MDFYADVLAGAEPSLATVSSTDVALGTGIGDPANPNFGNTWCDITLRVDGVEVGIVLVHYTVEGGRAGGSTLSLIFSSYVGASSRFLLSIHPWFVEGVLVLGDGIRSMLGQTMKSIL